MEQANYKLALLRIEYSKIFPVGDRANIVKILLWCLDTVIIS